MGGAARPCLAAALAAGLLLALAAAQKQDWCDIEQRVVEGTVSATQALAGRIVRCGMVEYVPFSTYNASLPVGEQWAGHDVEVLHEISARGSFAVEYVRLPNLQPGQTYTQLLDANRDTVDMMCTWWGETAARKDLGWSYTGGIIDVSLIVATKLSVTSETFGQVFWTFLEPFKADLWALVATSIVLSGFYLYWLDPTLAEDALAFEDEEDRGPPPLPEKLYNMVAKGWYMFAIQENYVPSTPWSRLYLISWSTVILVMTAAYTAQLTTFLIVERSTSGAVSGLDDLILQNKVTCKPQGARPCQAVERPAKWELQVDWINSFFRAQAPTLRTKGLSISSHFDAIRNGECAGSVMGLSELQLLLAEDTNCDIAIVGRSLNTVSGAFLAHYDQCGTTLASAVDALLQQIQEDGTKDRIWESYTTLPPVCQEAEASTSGDAASLALSAKTVGGLFIMHGCVAAMAGLGRLLAPHGMRRRRSGGVWSAEAPEALGGHGYGRQLVRVGSRAIFPTRQPSPLQATPPMGAIAEDGGGPPVKQPVEDPSNKVMPFESGS